MKYTFQTYVGIALIVMGLFIRFYRFGDVPVALNRDEAALGYNAFAIMQSGVDEWGNHLPLLFKSFGDYKLPGYVYITTFWIRIFGVEDWVIRLLSLFAGIGTIWLSYAFARYFSLNKHQSLLLVGFVAIQPWAIFYSRMAFEANVALFLLLLSLYALVQKQLVWQLCGLVCFFIAMLTYNTPLLLIPVFLVLFVFHPAFIKRQKIVSIVGVLVAGSIMTLLLAPVTFQKKAITIFSDPTLIDQQAKAYTAAGTPLAKLWEYKQLYWGRLMADRLFNSFSPSFLTMRGGANPWHSVPGGAHFYWITYILFFIGCIFLFKNKKLLMPSKLLFVFVLIGSLLPAIITIDAPHATRSLLFFWIVTMVSGWSFSQFKTQFKLALIIVIVLEVAMWGWKYFILFPEYRSIAWPVGLRESLLKNQGKPTVLVSSTDALGDQLYVYPLLYWKVLPEIYTKTATMMPPDNANMNRVSGFEGFRIATTIMPYEAVIERFDNGYCQLKK